jgi:hypothetical protein
MRVTLQLVLCSDDGREETVTDIASFNRSSQLFSPRMVKISKRIALSHVISLP